jgi:hypothetical protein
MIRRPHNRNNHGRTSRCGSSNAGRAKIPAPITPFSEMAPWVADLAAQASFAINRFIMRHMITDRRYARWSLRQLRLVAAEHVLGHQQELSFRHREPAQ